MEKGESSIEPVSAALPRDAQALIDAFRDRYLFSFDPFQEDAIRLIAEGNSVIVSAPTGAGKTLIAEFAIYRALAHQVRIAYTTPLKALSNQKYADFTRQWGEGMVGILTGDVKVNPRAPLVVMTTEILRNKFYAGESEGLAYVVLDECHYMGNEGRGTVWEEIIINCPPRSPARRPLRHSEQYPRDRRMDQPDASSDPGHSPSGEAGSPPVPALR